MAIIFLGSYDSRPRVSRNIELLLGRIQRLENAQRSATPQRLNDVPAILTWDEQHGSEQLHDHYLEHDTTVSAREIESSTQLDEATAARETTLNDPETSSRQSDGITENDRSTFHPTEILNHENSLTVTLDDLVGITVVHTMDAMGVATYEQQESGSSTDDMESQYFGPSSTLSFLSRVENKVDYLDASNRPPDNLGSPAARWLVAESQSKKSHPHHYAERSGSLSCMVNLPPRTEADYLVENYFAWFHNLYPFLNKNSFMKRYVTIWEPRRTGFPESDSESLYYQNNSSASDRKFYCMLNLILALGCHFHDEAGVRFRIEMSEVYFYRAKDLLDIDFLDRGSLQLVQTLLLMVQYLQSTDKPSACWNALGFAIRIAYGIGLHLVCNKSVGITDKSDDLTMMELQKRVWWGCVMLDRCVKLPFSITTHY